MESDERLDGIDIKLSEIQRQISKLTESQKSMQSNIDLAWVAIHKLSEGHDTFRLWFAHNHKLKRIVAPDE